MATIDFNDFVKWVLIKEPSLKLQKENEETTESEENVKETTEDEKIISDYSNQQLEEGYNDAIARCKSLKSYMSIENYRTLIYNYGLHIAITNSVFIAEVDENNIFEVSQPEEALQKLYVKYSVGTNTTGIVTSSSSGGSSASSQLPQAITQGNLETTYLLSTAYGRTVEMFLEQLQGILL